MTHQEASRKAEELRKSWDGPMNGGELAFCRDVQGFIQFAIENGLSFAMVVSALGHDANNLARYGFSLEAAKEDAFMPKVSRYSNVSSDSVGEAEEVED